jgi:choline-sulfatase
MKFLIPIALVAASCARTPQPPQNVILIVVDTLRADHMSLAGYERATTPFLDELAQQPGAFFFSNAQAPSPWTKPSVASILTGLYPADHQVDTHIKRLHGDFKTLAETFKELGYATGGVQSNVLAASFHGFDQGFDSWAEKHLAKHDNSTGVEINADATAFLDQADAPFFLYVQHYEPHFQYLRSGAEWYADYPGPLTGNESMDQLVGATAKLRDEERRFLVSRYDAEIQYQDELLRAFWQSLVASGHAEDTLVVLTSDHGEEFLEHGDLSHQYKLYQELVHVPLLIVDPRGAKSPLAQLSAQQLAQTVNVVDVGATILDLVDRGAAFPGRSIQRQLEQVDLSPSVAQTLVLGQGEDLPKRDMVTIWPYKMIRTQAAAEEAVIELYDLAADPAEAKDLNRDVPVTPDNAKRRDELVRRLDETLAERAKQAPPGERTTEAVDLTAEQKQTLSDLGYF